MVRLARDAGVDLEQALREADDREIARVRSVRSAEEAHQETDSAIPLSS